MYLSTLTHAVSLFSLGNNDSVGISFAYLKRLRDAGICIIAILQYDDDDI